MSNRAYLLQGHVHGTFHGGGWFAPYQHALEAVSAKQAAWAPEGKGNSIWQIVGHVTFYTQRTADDLRGLPRPAHRPTNDDTFGAQGDPADEAGWAAARAALFRAAAEYQEAIGALTDEQLDQPLPGEELPVSFKIGDVNLHNAYHLGQIVTLLQSQGAWIPVDWS